MESVTMLFNGFAVGCTFSNLLACVGGVLIGTLVGVLPGIGPVGAIALLLPLSYGMDVVPSVIMFSGIYYGAMYGGSTTSILLNVPGEAASVVTCLDGYEMAKKGRAGAALAVAAIGSFVAGTVGVIGLMFFAPVLANFALVFGPPEYFAIAFLGLVILTQISGGSMMKSSLMVAVGVMLGTMGMDSLSGLNRFTFGVDELQRGMELATVAMGLFGISEIIEVIANPKEPILLKPIRLRELYPSREDLTRSIIPIFRGGIIGFLTGLIPGPSATISTFLSYAVEKRLSKNREEFGQGAIEGVAGPESANNAAVSATMIPLLSLGLPFSATAAILLSGFMIHGVTPGPTLITYHPEVFWGLIASMYIGNVLLLIINLPLVGMFAYILKTPINILMPLVAIITLTGAYAINNSVFDIFLVITFGIIGFWMKQTGYSPIPLVIGLMLGPTIERGLVQGLIICNGDLWAFVSRPITGSILSVAALLIVFYAIRQIFRIKSNWLKTEQWNDG